MNKKAVFLDIDGTLCDRSGVVSESTKKALRIAAKNGHHMVLCTGRAKVQIFPWLDPSFFQGCVSAAGSCVTFGDKVIYEKVMEWEALRNMVDYFRKMGMPYFLQAEDAIYTESWSASEMHDAFLEIGRTEDDAKDILGKLVVLENPEEQPGVEKALYYRCKVTAEEMDAILGHRFTIQDSSYKVTRFCDGEITCRGITKAIGMEKYLEYTGIKREDSIGIGDGPNDFEMIDFAGTGVAMGNGVPALKEHADYVTDTVTNDGIYKAFDHLGLLTP